MKLNDLFASDEASTPLPEDQAEKAKNSVLHFVTSFYQLYGEYPKKLEVPPQIFKHLTYKTIYISPASHLLDPAGDFLSLLGYDSSSSIIDKAKEGRASYSFSPPLAIPISEAKASS